MMIIQTKSSLLVIGYEYLLGITHSPSRIHYLKDLDNTEDIKGVDLDCAIEWYVDNY